MGTVQINVMREYLETVQSLFQNQHYWLENAQKSSLSDIAWKCNVNNGCNLNKILDTTSKTIGKYKNSLM